MFGTFQHCHSFNSDLSKWNIERVTRLENTFEDNKVFNSDLSQWNVSSATNTARMFHACKKFNQNLSAWNVERVVRISFQLCLLCLQLPVFIYFCMLLSPNILIFFSTFPFFPPYYEDPNG